MNKPKTTVLTTAAVLALAAIPISQQLAEGKRLRSDLEAIEPAGAGNAERRVVSALTSQPRVDTADRWSPRTAGSLLDALAAPPDYRTLAKQLLSVCPPRYATEDPWSFTMVYSQLDGLSEEEYDEFLNVLADYPASDNHKRLAGLMIRMFHPELAESWQETLERVMDRGKGGNMLDSMTFWTREDPDAAVAWYREKVASGEIYGKGLNAGFEAGTFASLVATLAISRPKEAFAMFQERPQELRSPNLTDKVTSSLAKAMIKTGDDTYLRRMFQLHDRSRVLQLALKEYSSAWKFGEGVAFVEQFVTDPKQRADYIVQGVVEQDGVGRQGASLDWMRDNMPGAEARELFRRLGASGEIDHWLKIQKPGAARDHGYLGSIENRMESEEFSRALAEARKIGDQSLRATTLEMVGRQWLRNDEAEATRKLPADVLRQIQNQ